MHCIYDNKGALSNNCLDGYEPAIFIRHKYIFLFHLFISLHMLVFAIFGCSIPAKDKKE